MRFAQVMSFQKWAQRRASAAQNYFATKMFFFFFPSFLQRNLRRDKDRRNMLQFSMQTLPKSAKQKERWDCRHKRTILGLESVSRLLINLGSYCNRTH